MSSSWDDSSRGDMAAGASLGGGEDCFLRIGRGHGEYVGGMVGRGRAGTEYNTCRYVVCRDGLQGGI